MIILNIRHFHHILLEFVTVRKYFVQSLHFVKPTPTQVMTLSNNYPSKSLLSHESLHSHHLRNKSRIFKIYKFTNDSDLCYFVIII